MFARWTGYVEGEPRNRREFLARTHAYEVVRMPSKPLELGMKVKIYAVTPKHYCSPEMLGAPPDAYDAHVLGELTRVMGWRGTSVGMEIRNECWKSAVRRVRLEVPYIPDVTVRRLAHLGPDKGPRVARDDVLGDAADVVLPPTLWDCGAGGCLMRQTGVVQAGISYVYWPTGPEKRARVEPTERKRKRRRTRGPLEAVGWSED